MNEKTKRKWSRKNKLYQKMLLLSETSAARYVRKWHTLEAKRSPTIVVEFTDRQVNKFIRRMESFLICLL